MHDTSWTAYCSSWPATPRRTASGRRSQLTGAGPSAERTEEQSWISRRASDARAAGTAGRFHDRPCLPGRGGVRGGGGRRRRHHLLHQCSSDSRRSRARSSTGGEIRSAFAMTEPTVPSSDATQIGCSIRRYPDEYVITGRKWFPPSGRKAGTLPWRSCLRGTDRSTVPPGKHKEGRKALIACGRRFVELFPDRSHAPRRRVWKLFTSGDRGAGCTSYRRNSCWRGSWCMS